MEKIIQFLAANENDAYQVISTLKSLNDSGEISVGEIYVLEKDNEGDVFLKDSEGAVAGNTVFGAFAGGFMGLLAGPAGFLIGATYGALFGVAGDMADADTRQAYLDEIGRQIPPGKSMVVAHVYEEWEAPVNSQTGSYAEIKRIHIDEAADKALQNDLDELDRNIAAARKNLNQALAENKAAWQQKLDALNAKKNATLNDLKEKSEVQKRAYKNWHQKAKQKIHSLAK